MTGASDLAIDCTRTVLDNGLVVIVHENQAAPQVTLSVCYRVGSKDERAGQTGSAHLFEHLMFTGSANFPGLFNHELTKAGATMVNAYTSPDHTRFFETFPPGMLAVALYAEADRMGSFREHLTQAALEQQQTIVLQEKAQRAGGMLGTLPEIVRASLYPTGHPYHHPVIGSVQDIAGMTLASARDWHAQFYTPDNAVVVIGGPVDRTAALELVKAHFAHIAPSGQSRTAQTWIPVTSPRHRVRIEAAVAHGGLLKLVWPVAEACDRDRFLLELVASLLAGDETSPLHRALVRTGECLAVSASVEAGDVCSEFVVDLMLDGEADHGQMASAARAAIAKALSSSAEDDRLDRIRARNRSRLALSLDDLGTAVNIVLNGEMLWRNPMRYLVEVEAIDATRAEAFRRAGERWLCAEPLVVEVHPQRASSVGPAAAARPALPEIVQERRDSPAPDFTLVDHPAGMRTIEVPRPGSRDFVLRLDLARGLDGEDEAEYGIGMMVSTMPYHGIGAIDPAALRELIDRNGLDLNLGITPATFVIELHGPASAAETAAALLIDMVLAPRFDEVVTAERKREQANRLRAAQPDPMAQFESIAPVLLYGKDAADVRDPGGTASTIAALTVDRLLAHHGRLFDPTGATLFAAGSPETLRLLGERLEPLRSRWTRPADPLPPRRAVSLPERVGDRIQLVTAGPGDQAIVKLAMLLPVPTEVLDEATARALGFILERRLNARLRDELNWTYGVSVRPVETTRAELPPRLEIGSAVNAEHVADAIAEIETALSNIGGAVPLTEAEIGDYVAAARGGISSSIVSTGGRLAAVAMAVRPERPADIRARLEALDQLNVERIAALARAARAMGPLEWTVASTATETAARLSGTGTQLVTWSSD